MGDAAPKRMKQACNNCRRRKLKCDRLYPCDKCKGALLYCLYTDVLQRKGPKFRHFYPRSRSSTSSLRDGSHSPVSPTFPTPPQSVSSGDLEHLGCGSMSFPPTSVLGPTVGPQPISRRLPSLVIAAHLNIYLKYLYPIMPVFDSERVLDDASHPDTLPIERYAFLAAVCAATHIQLKLDGPEKRQDPRTPPNSACNRPGDSLIPGDTLLSEAVRARSECDMVEHASVDTLLASFFIFAAYGNLDKAEPAWFYLCQAVSMVYILGLDRESICGKLDPQETERKRRIAWLLFVTERAFALQRTKPAILRLNIRKPEFHNSDDPVLTYGFLNLINLFEKLPIELYDWICSDKERGKPSGSTMTTNIQNAICAPLLLDGVLETQQVDIRVTQQWLQAVMWKLGLSASVEKLIQTQSILPLNVPLTVGKSVMKTLSFASQSSIDAHGIGMEQKLFDIGTCISQITRTLQVHSTAATMASSLLVDPKELLWGILSSLSNIRGCQSHLFPILLENCGDIFNLESPSISEIETPGLPPGPCAKNDYHQFVSLPERTHDQHQNQEDVEEQPLTAWALSTPTSNMCYFPDIRTPQVFDDTTTGLIGLSHLDN